MMDCNGMSIAPTMPKKNSGDALERIFASEKPANVLTARMMEIEAAQTIVEFNNSWPTGKALKSLCQEIKECPELA